MSHSTHTIPVSSAIVTNHSPRMNCLGGTPLVTSTYQRPAVGPTTASSEDAGHRQPDRDALLRADDRVQRQRERRHELEEPLTEQLAAREASR